MCAYVCVHVSVIKCVMRVCVTVYVGAVRTFDLCVCACFSNYVHYVCLSGVCGCVCVLSACLYRRVGMCVLSICLRSACVHELYVCMYTCVLCLCVCVRVYACVHPCTCFIYVNVFTKGYKIEIHLHSSLLGIILHSYLHLRLN